VLDQRLRAGICGLLLFGVLLYGDCLRSASAAESLVKPIARLGRGSITGIALAPDRKTLAVSGSEGLWLYDMASLNKKPRLLRPDQPPTMSYLPPREVVSAPAYADQRAWDLPPGAAGGGSGGGEAPPTGFGNELVFSSDGSMLASSSFGVWLWNLKSGQGQPALNFGSYAQFSPDGTMLIGDKGWWDIASHQQKPGLPGLSAQSQLSPDGKTLAIIGEDQQLSLWDVATSQNQVIANRADIVAFNPTGKHLAFSEYHENMVHLFDLTTRKELFGLTGRLVSEKAFSPDGTLLALVPFTDQSAIQVWNVSNHRLRARLQLQDENDGVEDMAFSSNGRVLAVSYVAPRSDIGVVFGVRSLPVHLWDVATGNHIATLRNGPGELNSRNELTPQDVILTVDTASTIRLWGMSTTRLLGTILGYSGGVVEQVAFTPLNKLLVITSDTYTTTLAVQDIKTGDRRTVMAIFGGRLTISPDGSMVAVIDPDKNLTLWRVSPESYQVGQLGKSADAIAFSPGSQWLASVGSDGVQLWDTWTGKLNRTIPITGVGRVLFSPDGTLLALGGFRDGNDIQIWSMEAQRVIVYGEMAHLQAMAFSLDSSMFAAANADHTVAVWATATGERHDQPYQCGVVDGLTFTPTDRRLMVGCIGGTVETLHTESVAPQQDAAKPDQFTGSPDGKLFAFSGVLWDSATGSKVADIGGESVAFSDDGSVVAVGQNGGTVELWAIGAR
jgi:WD40 repeat protein